MTPTIQRIIDGVIAVEGGFVDHPNDPGGATKYGITQAVARSNGYSGHMRDLPRSTAFQIYYTRYVVGPNFDDIAAIDEKVAEELIDTGVNAGVQRAAMWFQEALNGLNSRGADYPDLSVDGDIGPATITAFQAFKRRLLAARLHLLLTSAMGRKRTPCECYIPSSEPPAEPFIVRFVDICYQAGSHAR